LGLVACGKHGNSSGPLCCGHVLTAINGAGDVKPSSAVGFRVDMLDDGTEFLDYLVCSPCARDYSLVGGTDLPGEYFDGGKTPWVAPTCDKCLEEWLQVGG
jgi:hypothetical protein